MYFKYVLNNPIFLRYFSDLERAISCSWQRISMKFADYVECFVILFAFVILNVECEINTILTVSLNFTAKSWIMVSSLLVPDLDRCLALGHFIKKYSLVTYVLKFELDYLFIKDIKKLYMWWFDKHVFLKNKITIQNVHFKKWINVILIDDITSVIILIICHWSVNNSLFLKYLYI